MTKPIRTEGIRTKADLKARCWVDKDTRCWHWRGCTDGNGVATMWSPDLQRTVSLGVMACFLATGKGPLPGQVWHCTCGTRNCANPAHRVCGTRSSQMLAAKLRLTPLHRARISATKRARGKLTDEQRREIAESTDTLSVLAKRYGLSIDGARKVRMQIIKQPNLAYSVFSWRPNAAADKEASL